MATQKINVEVEERAGRGKNVARRLRREGRIPANVYGLDRPAVAVSVASRTIAEVLRSAAGRNAILTLKAGEGQARDVMIRELQRDPVTGAVTHVDFKRLDLTARIEVQVPIQLVGVPTGVKNDGGILDFIHRETVVSCLPTAIPEHVEVDVTGLGVGKHIEVKDLPGHEGVDYIEDPSTIIAVVAAPRVEEEVAAAEVAEGEEVAPVAAEAEEEEGKEAGKSEAAEKSE